MYKLSKSCCLIIVGLIILLSSCSADNIKHTETSLSSAETVTTTVTETEITTADNNSSEVVSIESIKEQISIISVKQAKDVAIYNEYKSLNKNKVIAVKAILIKEGLDFISKKQNKV